MMVVEPSELRRPGVVKSSPIIKLSTLGRFNYLFLNFSCALVIVIYLRRDLASIVLLHIRSGNNAGLLGRKAVMFMMSTSNHRGKV